MGTPMNFCTTYITIHRVLAVTRPISSRAVVMIRVAALASGEDGGHGQGHLLADEGIADQDDGQGGADDADQGGDNHFPLPPQLGEVDGGTQGDNEDSRDDIAETGDLGILDHRPGQNAAPEAGQEQDRNTQHGGKDRLCLLGNELTRRIDAEQNSQEPEPVPRPSSFRDFLVTKSISCNFS